MGLFSGIKKNVIIFGAVSFLTDVSSEMISPLLPVFLTTFLGAGTAAVGLIEGVADSLSSLLDIFVGYASDTQGSRKKFVIGGYGLSSLSKIGIALATSWPFILIFRGVERIGKSLRTSPRDAIIAASSTQESRGKAFGLHRAMDTAGAVVGPIIAYLLLSILGSSETAYRAVFYAAVIPAFLAVFVIWFFVREPKQSERTVSSNAKKPSFWRSLRSLSPNFRAFVAVSCLFSLSYFSFALLIVRASEIGISAQQILLAYLLFNIIYALSSIPVGQLSDRIGRKVVIGGAFILYALILAGFAAATSLWQIALLFALYGIFVAADDSVNKAFISDIMREKERGMALGAYNTAVGAAYLPASVIFGALWAATGATVAFTAAATVAALSGFAFFYYVK
jgi:MFS family permease